MARHAFSVCANYRHEILDKISEGLPSVSENAFGSGLDMTRAATGDIDGDAALGIWHFIVIS